MMTMSQQMENSNKEKLFRKKKQKGYFEWKNTIIEMSSLLNSLSSRFELVEERSVNRR